MKSEINFDLLSYRNFDGFLVAGGGVRPRESQE